VKLTAGQPVATPFSVLTLIDSPRLQQCAAESWVARNCPPRWTLPPLPRRQRAERLRIGYYSADFYHHATTVLAEDLFGRHDRQRFEIVGLRFGRHRADEVTQRLATAFDRFIDVHERSDIDVARLSRELGIDIAVDLKGMTEQHRLGIFAHRAAPVQVNYLGFPGTSGASYMDYIIADRMLIPERYRDCYGEKVVYLPNSYQINGRGRAIAATAPTREQIGLPAQGFVFCCFNNVYKITPAVFDVWMSVLRRVAGSVLWLMEGGADAATRLREAAEARGVGGERLVFAERLPTAQHLARHRLADLFIDTLPCNAHTTASDALWAGLPLVTCAGESFASRVASSLLHTVGLPELIARNLTQYESLIVRLANEPVRLAALRERLERNRLQGPLFDLDRYVQGLESAYQMMYERHQSGQPPEHILAG
jgi:predicted O-linked N-acetylglucosamine transferase (SPINDLY family)